MLFLKSVNSHVVASLGFILFSTTVSPVFAGSTDNLATSSAPDRAATGDITQWGGARRITTQQSANVKAAIKATKAKNVIMFLGDGMGDSEITIARNYAMGAGGFFKGIDALPLTGQYTHYSLDKKTLKPSYVTDSAASASAWATGVKTYNGALSVDVFDKDHVTLLELAKANGLATGNVTTAEIQDATPAALYAHVTNRSCYGPIETTERCPTNALQNGGRGSITEQLLAVRADISLGGGAKSFEQASVAGKNAGKTLYQQATEQGFKIVTNAQEFNAISKADQKTPLLGLFNQGDMTLAWQGPNAVYHGNIDIAPVTCQPNDKLNGQEPSLAQMTQKAIDLLSVNPKGFYLQVEGASIDKQSHAANTCAQIGETVEFDKAIQVGLAFARKHGDTLVIVTADHAHSGQIIDANAKAPGLTLALMTKDGAVMAVSYGNSEGKSQGHTGTQLRLAAYGPQAANVVGLTDQTDLFFTIKNALGLK